MGNGLISKDNKGELQIEVDVEKDFILDTGIEKIWTHKGLKCCVIANPLGHRCGYVGVEKSNKFYGIYFDQPITFKGQEITIEYLVSVHGGITFSGEGKWIDGLVEDLWYFGYDTAHGGDGKDVSIMSKKAKELHESFVKRIEEREYFLFKGIYDGEIRTLEYCTEECESLAEQLNVMESFVLTKSQALMPE